jgi:YVTN family beta-propeller protein
MNAVSKLVTPTNIFCIQKQLVTFYLLHIDYINPNTVSIIDESTDKIQATIKVGGFPESIDVNSLNNSFYVANRGSNTDL